MKKLKRLISMVLTLAMLVSVFSLTSIPASAATNPYEKWQDVDGDDYSEV